MVNGQDYPAIELLVSDNGMNGSTVRHLVEENCARPYRFRQNPTTVEMMPHFNQLLGEAAGEYFVLLPDDEEISPNFVSALIRRLQRYPKAVIAFGRQEIVDPAGAVLDSFTGPGEAISGTDFIQMICQPSPFGFRQVSTFLARVRAMREAGGYPEFTRGVHSDTALVMKLCLSGSVAFASDCLWRNRLDEASCGLSISIRELASATREFIRHIRTEPTTIRYAAAHPLEWPKLERCLVRMARQTYLFRWSTIYKRRMAYWRWVLAALVIPPNLAYYSRAGCILFTDWKRRARGDEDSFGSEVYYEATVKGSRQQIEQTAQWQ